MINRGRIFFLWRLKPSLNRNKGIQQKGSGPLLSETPAKNLRYTAEAGHRIPCGRTVLARRDRF